MLASDVTLPPMSPKPEKKPLKCSKKIEEKIKSILLGAFERQDFKRIEMFLFITPECVDLPLQVLPPLAMAKLASRVLLCCIWRARRATPSWCKAC
jgi:hypothetical protein